jgi:hypothetical protein
MGSPQRQKLVLDKVELNPALADSLFALPANALPAAKPDSAAAAKPAAGKDAAKPATTGGTTPTQTVKATKPDAAASAKKKP